MTTTETTDEVAEMQATIEQLQIRIYELETALRMIRAVAETAGAQR